jgi:hypothetical protein
MHPRSAVTRLSPEPSNIGFTRLSQVHRNWRGVRRYVAKPAREGRLLSPLNHREILLSRMRRARLLRSREM